MKIKLWMITEIISTVLVLYGAFFYFRDPVSSTWDFFVVTVLGLTLFSISGCFYDLKSISKIRQNTKKE